MRFPVDTWRLDNGIDVILLPDPSLPKVVVDVWYDVGSADDPLGKSGFAHLFEHLMFKGTQNVGEGEFDRLMEAVGGSNNASTGDERTNYYDFGPKGALELLLWLEADRMTGLQITQTKLDVEREVVRNERRQNYEDAPYGEVWLALPAMLFPPEHPLSRSGIGEHPDLLAATLEDVTAFYAKYYVPGNASVTIAGDFDPIAIRPWILETLGSLPARPVPERVLPPVPDVPHEAFRQLTDDVALPATVSAWHSAALYTDEDAALDVLAGILAGSDDSRLVKRLVYDDRSAQEIDVAQMSGRWGSIFMVQAFVAPDHTLEEVDAAIDEELAAFLSDKPPTDEEIERSRNNREIEKLYAAESLLGRAETVQSWRLHLGQVDGYEHDVGRFRRVDRAALIAEAAKLTEKRRARLHVVGEAE